MTANKTKTKELTEEQVDEIVALVKEIILINAGIDRTSALGANRICRDGGIDENDPEPPIGCQFAVMHNRRRPQM